jgi:hypothetical protein
VRYCGSVLSMLVNKTGAASAVVSGLYLGGSGEYSDSDSHTDTYYDSDSLLDRY